MSKKRLASVFVRKCPWRGALRVVTALALAGLVSGCSAFYPIFELGMPIPYVDKRGLGLSPIGDYIRMNQRQVSVNEVGLKDGLAKLIAERTPPNGLSREDAESLGMHCAPAPNTECAYLGEQSYRREHFPRDHRDYGKTTVQEIEVRFSYLKPQGLVVKVREHDVPHE
jgi:hypothetical protein